jgi:L,D-peptidoglycan transpeptidase YkuD (ErfK/YbiS/YcfS/YnhG family)
VDFLVTQTSAHRGVLACGDAVFPCALGRSGVRADKSEGDGATPKGCFALRRLLYRADRIAKPVTLLPAQALDPADGWCDDPADPFYNRHVRLPYRARAEVLWRDDGVYDAIVVLGCNDDPVIAGRGSAIFLHAAKPDLAATEGCIALKLDDLLTALRFAGAADRLCVAGP